MQNDAKKTKCSNDCNLTAYFSRYVYVLLLLLEIIEYLMHNYFITLLFDKLHELCGLNCSREAITNKKLLNNS